MKVIRSIGVNEAFVNLMREFSNGIRQVDSASYILHPRYAYELFNVRKTDDETSPDRDKPMLEGNYLLEIAEPTDRLVYAKHVDYYNLAGLWLFLLRGTEQVNEIEFYNSRARHFVDEEVSPSILRGAWGARLFGGGAVAKAIALLRETPQSRRIVIPVFHPEDLGYPSRNLPCLTEIQFAVVGGHLEMYTTMRAQAAVGVLPYDLFLLTMLHEYVSVRTGITRGAYYHWMPLCGVRESEFKTVIEAAHWSGKYDIMPLMPNLEPGHKALLLKTEEMIRRGKVSEGMDMSILLPRYWRGLLAFSAKKRTQNTQFADNYRSLTLDDSFFPRSFVEYNTMPAVV